MAEAKKPREPWDVMSLPELEGVIIAEDAADLLGLSRESVHRRIKRGTLRAWRIGRKPVIVVLRSDIESLPMTPQRRRELRLRGELPEAELGEELPEG